MQLKSILNRVQKHKSFVYEEVEWGKEGERASLRVSIRVCRQKGGGPEDGELSPALPFFHGPSCRGTMSRPERFFREF